MIEIDIKNCRIHLEVADETLQARREKWTCPKKDVTGYAARYMKLVSSAAKGAVLE